MFINILCILHYFTRFFVSATRSINRLNCNLMINIILYYDIIFLNVTDELTYILY